MDYANSYHTNQQPVQQPPAPQQTKRIKPWLLAVIIGLAVLVVWVICFFFIHIYSDATCTSPKKCYICGKYSGEPLNHDWVGKSCTAPAVCSRCGEAGSFKSDHTWLLVSCTEPRQCSLCGFTEGAPAGHSWSAATCNAPQTCTVCGQTQGAALGHSWSVGSCTQPSQCMLCGATSGSANGHSWAPATYIAPETCTQCGATSGAPLAKPDISVEGQVTSIRTKVNAIAANADAGDYRKVTLREGVVAYYNGSSLKKVVVYRGTDGIDPYSDSYSRTYYFENNIPIFAFFEGKDSHRLYFYEGSLMRWRYTPKGTTTATNHDFDFSDEFFLWEELALDEVDTFF